MSIAIPAREAPPRYLPDHILPPYAYLPGRDPHPTRHPQGHSFGRDEAARPYLPPQRWRENEDYLLGVDLYNQGYLWEAHEAWEGIWHPARGNPLLADYLQGLIQCAAAALKLPMGQPAGLAKLSALALERLERVHDASPKGYMGLDVGAFAEAFRGFAGKAEELAARPALILESPG